jgi:putative transposase
MARIREKKHRLTRDAYQGRVEVAFTACVRGKECAFADTETVEALKAILAKYARAKACSVPVYCFMPDHLHVMLRGLEDRSDCWAAMCAFKLQSGVWLAKNRPSVKLQKDLYDHVVRSSEESREQARYIAANPCRAGLVERWHLWPHTGSVDERVEDWLI